MQKPKPARLPRVLHVTEATEAGVATFVATVSQVEPDCTVLLLAWRTPTDHLAACVREAGADLVVVPAQSAWRHLREIHRLVKAHDVLFLHSGIAGLVGRAAAGVRLIRPHRLVYAPHLSMGYVNRFWRLAEQLLTRYVRPQWLMLVSESERRHFLADFGAAGRIGTSIVFPWIAPPGRAINRETPTAGALRLVTIGRINVQKAPLRIARLLNQLARDGIGVQFLWVGDGPLRGDFLSALTPSVAERVRVSGWVRDVPQAVSAFSPHFYVNLSLREGFSIAAMEAMAMGLPVIASPVQGNEDLVEPGMNGLFCSFNDLPGFRRELEEALSPDVYDRLCCGALRTVGRFDEAAFRCAYSRMLRDVLDEGGQRL